MKKVCQSILIVLLFFSCSQEPEDLFVDYRNLPYVADSSFISSINFEYFKKLSGEDLIHLYDNVKQLDNNTVGYAIQAIIEIELKGKENISDEEMKGTYWQVQHYSAYALHTFVLTPDIKAYTWYLSFSDGKQGPELIMVTLYKNNKPYSCFQLSKLYSYTFSQAWNSGKEEGIINNDGKVIIKVYDKFAGNSEGIKQSEEDSSVFIKEFSVKTGDIEIFKN